MMSTRFDRRDDRGAAAVEFALVLPLLVLLLFGIVEFGRAYFVQISLTGAAREGARDMAIYNDPVQAEAVTRGAAGTGIDSVSFSPAVCSPNADITVTAATAVPFNVPFWDVGTFDIEGIGVMRCGG